MPMNRQVGKKLNELWAYTDKPLHLSITSYAVNLCGRRNGPENAEIVRIVDGIYAGVEAIAVEREIVAAATERREAHLVVLDFWHSGAHRDGATKIALDLARPRIEEYLQSLNAEHAARYERYRLACEQGIAVAPEEDSRP